MAEADVGELEFGAAVLALEHGLAEVDEAADRFVAGDVDADQELRTGDRLGVVVDRDVTDLAVELLAGEAAVDAEAVGGGVGGTVGALLTGVFAEKAVNGLADGLLYGNPRQVGIQLMAVAAAIVYSGAMSFILLKVIGALMPLHAGLSDESAGLDITQHGEEAYLHIGGTSSQAHAG